MNKTIDNYITIEFNYDDDLGKLQQMTKDNLTFLEKLDSWGDITSKEYEATYQAIHKYYVAELERQLQIAKRKAGMIQI